MQKHIYVAYTVISFRFQDIKELVYSTLKENTTEMAKKSTPIPINVMKKQQNSEWPSDIKEFEAKDLSYLSIPSYT